MTLDVHLDVRATCDLCGDDEDAAKFGPIASEVDGRRALEAVGWRFASTMFGTVSAVCGYCADD